MGKNLGIITEIKKFATHDGPGIRTTVFVKGCPLRCKWCSNPETQKLYPQLYFIDKKCQSYGDCVEVCPEDAISPAGNMKIDRHKCVLCMKCVEICPHGALKKVGDELTVDEVAIEIEKDIPFYGNNGGLTISGGEPLYQANFTLALLKKCHEKGISTVIDTSGFAETDIIEKVLKYTDLVLLDIKHMDSYKHKEGTGVSNEIILENAKLMAQKTNVRISLPLIPDFNDDLENLKETAKFVRSIDLEWIDVNPFHALGTNKYKYLGLESPYTTYKEISKEKIKNVRELFNAYGLKTTVGRMM